jgi:acetolactate synthase-1/2/3 large subunit
MITEPGRFAHHFRRAMRRALSDRPGPVHLNIPVDLWNKPTAEQWFDPATYRTVTYAYDRAEVELAAELLFRAVRPAILVGSGVAGSGAEEDVVALAEVLPAVAATTPRAKGVFPEDHPLSLGVLGFGGQAAAREVFLGDEVDVLFTVGASLNETTTFNWDSRLQPRQTLIQLDIDIERIGRNYPVDVPLVGDARGIVSEIVDQLRRAWHDGRHFASQWSSLAGSELRSRGGDDPARSSTAVPIVPQRWRADLEEVLPDDAIVYSDIGGHMLFNIHDLHLRAQQRFVLNLGFGSMGHGTAAPIGAALASPGRPIVAIIGDACFTMNGMEILTAVEYGIPVVWIVENNQRHGITWHGSRTVSGKPMQSIVYRHPIDVLGMARAMGVAVWRVERPGQIQAAMREALAARAPALIEVCVDPEVAPPLADRAKTVAGFSK